MGAGIVACCGIVSPLISSGLPAKLALVQRTPFPARADWAGWLESHPDGDATAVAISTDLTVLKTHSPSLEDAYLRIVGTAME